MTVYLSMFGEFHHNPDGLSFGADPDQVDDVGVVKLLHDHCN